MKYLVEADTAARCYEVSLWDGDVFVEAFRVFPADIGFDTLREARSLEAFLNIVLDRRESNG